MLELYILESCPYCKKVIEHFNNNDIKYVVHDVSKPEEYEKLMKLGGKSQVPFMYDTNNNYGLYESDEIITYR